VFVFVFFIISFFPSRNYSSSLCEWFTLFLRVFLIDPCEDKQCSFNALCVVNNNYKASCQCPKCPPTTKPVCGTDGKNYVNECELRKQSCTTKTNIRVLHQGKCGACVDNTTLLSATIMILLLFWCK
jgi:coxsackievirus/adenovirus receptor